MQGQKQLDSCISSNNWKTIRGTTTPSPSSSYYRLRLNPVPKKKPMEYLTYYLPPHEGLLPKWLLLVLTPTRPPASKYPTNNPLRSPSYQLATASKLTTPFTTRLASTPAVLSSRAPKHPWIPSLRSVRVPSVLGLFSPRWSGSMLPTILTTRLYISLRCGHTWSRLGISSASGCILVPRGGGRGLRDQWQCRRGV